MVMFFAVGIIAGVMFAFPVAFVLGADYARGKGKDNEV